MTLAYGLGFTKGLSFKAAATDSASAASVYTNIHHSHFDCLEESGLCTKDCLNKLQMLELTEGKVEDWKIRAAWTDFFGLPSGVTVVVRRNGRARVETLVRQGNFAFDDVWTKSE